MILRYIQIVCKFLTVLGACRPGVRQIVRSGSSAGIYSESSGIFR